MRIAIVTLASSLTLFSCTKQERAGGGTKPHIPSPPPATLDVKVAIAAVNLADDCGHADASRVSEEAKRARSAESESQGDMACDQTSMQLTLAASGAGVRTEVEILHVELFDAKTGASMGAMFPRNPQVWDPGASTYQVWDRRIGPSEQRNVMFDLGAPDWARQGGRFAAQGRLFRLQANVRIGGAESTLTKDVQVQEIRINPEVET